MARQANRGSFKPKDPRINRGKRASHADSVINPYSGHGTSRDRRTYTTFGVRGISDREAVAMRRGDWMSRTIIEALPEDAFRRGYDISLQDKKQAEALVAAAEDLCVNETLEETAKLERMAGGSAILPILDGAVGALDEPLDLNYIAEVTALHILEARELIPISWYKDLSSRKFGQPEYYSFMPVGAHTWSVGMPRIHESRLIIFPGKRASKTLEPGQRDGWGDSVLLPVREVIADFGLGIGSAATLIASLGRGVIKKKGLMQLLASKEGREVLEHWRNSFDMDTSALRAALIGEEDEYTLQSSPISGADAVLLILAQVAAGAAEMPMTRFLGMAPGGLNATGENDTRAWYDTVGRAQSTRYRRPTEQVLRLIMRSTQGPTRGTEPDVWSIQWRPLWTPSEKEQAETREVQMRVDTGYMDREVITSKEVRTSRFGGDTWSAETQLDADGWDEQVNVPLDPAMVPAPVETAPTGSSNAIAASVEASPGEPPPEDLALNGAQVTSLVEVIKASVLGEIPRESAAAIVELAFRVPAAQAQRLLGPATFKPAATEPVPAPSAPPFARADEDGRLALLRKLSPKGRCAECDADVGHAKLEVHHIDGRTWKPEELSLKQRNQKYLDEYEAGVKMSALCRTCNASDGAKNKQEH